MADFYKAFLDGVSEQELREAFEKELADAKEKLHADKRKEKLDYARDCFICELLAYYEVLIDTHLKEDEYERFYNIVEELIIPFEDLIVSLDIKHLTDEELERIISELLNK